MTEKILGSSLNPLAWLKYFIQAFRWSIKWLVIVILSILLAIALLYFAYAAYEVFAYYYLSKGRNQYPVNLEPLFLGLKLMAFYVVTVCLLSQYRNSPTLKSIVKRSVIIGCVLGMLLIGAAVLDRIVMHYYDNKIDCKLPNPTQAPICNIK